MRIRWEGTDQLSRKLRAMPGVAERGARLALEVIGRRVMAVSQVRVPRDTGVLRDSKTIVVRDNRAGNPELRLGYGGAASAYAAYIHEGQESWMWNVPGTGPKYLEGPMLEEAPRMGRILADALEREVRRAAQ